jgi:hypothetical protein
VQTRWIGFGEIEIEGRRYEHDVIIESGAVSKRAKKASKKHRDAYGHTPLSAEERIPWGGARLIVGTGAYGKLPLMPEVEREARRRGVEVVAVSTPEALALIGRTSAKDTYAILHVTC